MGNLKKKVLLTNLVSCKVIEFERQSEKREQITGATWRLLLKLSGIGIVIRVKLCLSVEIFPRIGMWQPLPGHGLNEDWGGHLHTRAWHPLFQKMR